MEDRIDNLRRRLETRSRRTATGCIEWTGTTSLGYGRIWDNGKNARTHRIAWIVANGEVPAGQFVLHRCNNPLCMNVDHLTLGSHAENMKHRQACGRQAKGAKHGCAKLTEQDVIAIRASQERTAVLAARYNIAEHGINDIRAGRRWRDVGGPRPDLLNKKYWAG